MIFYSFVLFQNLLCLEAGLVFPQVFQNIGSSICQPATSRSIADAKQSMKTLRDDESLFMCDASFSFLLLSPPVFWRKCVRLDRDRSAHVIIRCCCTGSDGRFVTTISIFLLFSFCVLSAMISVGITDQFGYNVFITRFPPWSICQENSLRFKSDKNIDHFTWRTNYFSLPPYMIFYAALNILILLTVTCCSTTHQEGIIAFPPQ
jgi:hypothetical protein